LTAFRIPERIFVEYLHSTFAEGGSQAMRKAALWRNNQMWKKLAIVCAAGTFVLGSIQPVSGQGICGEGTGRILTPVRGKIFNNAQLTGNTLGTAHVLLGSRQNRMKMKCGLLGENLWPDPSQPLPDVCEGEPICFQHTFVCDDQTQVGPDPETDTTHSQLTVITRGDVVDVSSCPDYAPFQEIVSFSEISTPVSGSGRGLFYGAGEGSLDIDGTFNCFGAIDMEFIGEVCLLPLP